MHHSPGVIRAIKSYRIRETEHVYKILDLNPEGADCEAKPLRGDNNYKKLRFKTKDHTAVSLERVSFVVAFWFIICGKMCI